VGRKRIIVLALLDEKDKGQQITSGRQSRRGEVIDHAQAPKAQHWTSEATKKTVGAITLCRKRVGFL
jgi:hypothetical protein